MSKTIVRDTPLTEITLRKYERPYQLSRRDLVKKICLSLGLLQPGDTRDSIIDVLYALLESDKPLDMEVLIAKARKNRETHNLNLSGCSAPNIRRGVKRLKTLLLIEKKESGYRLAEGAAFSEILQEMESYIVQGALKRIQEYAAQVDDAFQLKRKS